MLLLLSLGDEKKVDHSTIFGLEEPAHQDAAISAIHLQGKFILSLCPSSGIGALISVQTKPSIVQGYLEVFACPLLLETAQWNQHRQWSSPILHIDDGPHVPDCYG